MFRNEKDNVFVLEVGGLVTEKVTLIEITTTLSLYDNNEREDGRLL